MKTKRKIKLRRFIKKNTDRFIALLSTLSFMLLLGTVGAVEAGTLDTSKGLIQAGFAVIVWASTLIIMDYRKVI